MKITTVLPYLSFFSGLGLFVQAHADYNEYDARSYVDGLNARDYADSYDLTARDYIDELTARDLILDYHARSELISELKTRELIDELKNRLQARSHGSEAKFRKAVSIISALPKHGKTQVTQAEQLFFYKYYMQATVGDNAAARPTDFAAKAKWDAWHSVRGVSKEEAEKQYINKTIAILQAAGDKKFVDEIHAA